MSSPCWWGCPGGRYGILGGRLCSGLPFCHPPDRVSDRAQFWRDVDHQRGYDHPGWWSGDGALKTIFAVVVDETQGNEILSWHVEDRQGNRAVNLGGPGISNIDLVLGQGGLPDSLSSRTLAARLLQRLYTAIEQREDKRTP